MIKRLVEEWRLEPKNSRCGGRATLVVVRATVVVEEGRLWW